MYRKHRGFGTVSTMFSARLVTLVWRPACLPVLGRQLAGRLAACGQYSTAAARETAGTGIQKHISALR